MVEARHGSQTIENGLHSAISFEFADRIERLAAGPFENFDKYKLALQTDDNSLWLLIDESEETWYQISDGYGSSSTSGVFGPDTSTDNAIVRWNGTDGYYIQDSNIIIDDNDNIRGINEIVLNHTDPTTVSHEEGKIFYDSENHTLAVLNDHEDVILQVGQEQHAIVVNKTGVTIPNGSAVYVNGVQGNRPTIALADASINASSYAVAVTTHDILNNSEGLVTTFGSVDGVDTRNFTPGGWLYLSGVTPGGFSNGPPTDPYHFVWFIGIALNSTVNGSIFVRPSGPSHLGYMHDVGVDGPIDGYYLRGNGTLWNGSFFDNDVISSIFNNTVEPYSIGNENYIGDSEDSFVRGDHVHALGGNVGGDLSGELPNPLVIDLTIENEQKGSILYNNGDSWVQLPPSYGDDGYDDGYALVLDSEGLPQWSPNVSPNHVGDVTIDGTLTVTGQVYPIATEEGGWVDILGPVVPPANGPTVPVLTALSSPHDNFLLPLFAIGDKFGFSAHIPHGINASTGLYLHAHILIDGTSTNTVKFQFEYSYAHGYSREVLSSPSIVTIEQAGTGVAKTHQILEIANPILTNSIETDGILNCVFSRITNGGTNVTDNVFVTFLDVHAQLVTNSSTNRNYPFEP